MTRQAQHRRTTKETQIDLSIDVDGSGQIEVTSILMLTTPSKMSV